MIVRFPCSVTSKLLQAIFAAASSIRLLYMPLLYHPPVTLSFIKNGITIVSFLLNSTFNPKGDQILQSRVFARDVASKSAYHPALPKMFWYPQVCWICFHSLQIPHRLFPRSVHETRLPVTLSNQNFGLSMAAAKHKSLSFTIRLAHRKNLLLPLCSLRS